MLDLSQNKDKNFSHFCNEWKEISKQLINCEKLLFQMSENDSNREELRQILKSIEPKKYSKNKRKRNQKTLHKLKELTQLLMTSDLKRSTSLQNVSIVKSNDVTDDTTTATLPRLRRRSPRLRRLYLSFDSSDDNKDDETNNDLFINNNQNEKQFLNETQLNESEQEFNDLKETERQLSPTQSSSQQKSSNRFSCDVSSLLSSSPTSQLSSLSRDSRLEPTSQSSKQILKYSKKRLRGPYGEMLESMMNSSKEMENKEKKELIFLKELLNSTQKQRLKLDLNSLETIGTKEETNIVEDVNTIETTEQQKSITDTIGRHLDTRTHIVGELYDTEKTFCEQLRDLCEKYAKPLNEMQIIDQNFSEIIFGKIPEILKIHSKFLEELRKRIKEWNEKTLIGDLFDLLFVENISEVYLQFVNKWFESKLILRKLMTNNSRFLKFIEREKRLNSRKLSLNELLISIIQRIPRFELLLKQLLKNTSKEHLDYVLIEKALKKIHSLNVYINRIENDADVNQMTTQLSSESMITSKEFQELICDSFPLRQELTQNMKIFFLNWVSFRKRERLLVLFQNNLLIFQLKGKKKSEKFEENKYKLYLNLNLEKLELIQNLSQNSLELIENDLKILKEFRFKELSQTSRQLIEPLIQELSQSLNAKKIDLKNLEKNSELITNELDFNSTQNPIIISFSTQELRQKFETIFQELKQSKELKQKNIPEFVCALPIRKTRAGLQLTCAEPTISTNDVWICNSDGFVGQISVLSFGCNNEPTVVSCNGVCNSRIICLTSVPKALQTTTQNSEESDVSDSDYCDNNEPNGSQESSTMWFGTEDSSVHIYSCCDAIRIKKNKLKVTLSAKIEAIVYFEERVFVGLANNSVAIFERDQMNPQFWSTNPLIKENISCFRFCVTSERHLWTLSSKTISIRNRDLDVIYETSIEDIDEDVDDFLEQISFSKQLSRVFISSHNSTKIHFFSSQKPFNYLSFVSINSTINKALEKCETIIRQHKSACLKISALLSVNEKLFIGTSAGIICVFDSINNSIEIVPNGHTGHVRFLTSIETTNGKTFIISGGDGLETFGVSSMTTITTVDSNKQSLNQTLNSPQNQMNLNLNKNELNFDSNNGRDDSTNHLIIWTFN